MTFSGLCGRARLRSEYQINFTLPANVPTGWRCDPADFRERQLSSPHSLSDRGGLRSTTCVLSRATLRRSSRSWTRGIHHHRRFRYLAIPDHDSFLRPLNRNSIAGCCTNSPRTAVSGAGEHLGIQQGSCQIVHRSALAVNPTSRRDHLPGCRQHHGHGPAVSSLSNQALNKKQQHSSIPSTRVAASPGQTHLLSSAGTYKAWQVAGGNDVGL